MNRKGPVLIAALILLTLSAVAQDRGPSDAPGLPAIAAYAEPADGSVRTPAVPLNLNIPAARPRMAVVGLAVGQQKMAARQRVAVLVEEQQAGLSPVLTALAVSSGC